MSLKPGDFVLRVRVQTQWEGGGTPHTGRFGGWKNVIDLERVYIRQPWGSVNDDKRKAEMGVPWCLAGDFSESERGLTWCLDDPEEIAALKVVLGLG